MITAADGWGVPRGATLPPIETANRSSADRTAANADISPLTRLIDSAGVRCSVLHVGSCVPTDRRFEVRRTPIPSALERPAAIATVECRRASECRHFAAALAPAVNATGGRTKRQTMGRERESQHVRPPLETERAEPDAPHRRTWPNTCGLEHGKLTRAPRVRPRATAAVANLQAAGRVLKRTEFALGVS